MNRKRPLHLTLLFLVLAWLAGFLTFCGGVFLTFLVYEVLSELNVIAAAGDPFAMFQHWLMNYTMKPLLGILAGGVLLGVFDVFLSSNSRFRRYGFATSFGGGLGIGALLVEIGAVAIKDPAVLAWNIYSLTSYFTGAVIYASTGVVTACTFLTLTNRWENRRREISAFYSDANSSSSSTDSDDFMG